jgi:hypothetical protein
MRRGMCALLLLVLLTSPAYARGPFGAFGMVSELKIEGSSVTFRMIGGAALRRMNAPKYDGTAWKGTVWQPVDLLVRIRFSDSKGYGRDAKADAVRAYDQLRSLLADKGTEEIQIDVNEPSLTFSDDAELKRVDGTGLHAHSVVHHVVP